MDTSFFSDMLQSIAERGRALIDRTRDRREVAEQRSASLVQLCEDLLSGRGEASGVALAREILARYGELKTGPRIAFFEALATRFGPDRTRLAAAEAINSGITFVHDWCHNIRGFDYAEADLRALRETGVRARFSYGGAQGMANSAGINLGDFERLH